MQNIDLFTGPGAPRRTMFVTTVQIPPFEPDKRPAVIIWGNRTFLLAQAQSPENLEHPAYTEVFAVTATLAKEPI